MVVCLTITCGVLVCTKSGNHVLISTGLRDIYQPVNYYKMKIKNTIAVVNTTPIRVPIVDHEFMKAILCNDEASSDEELQAHFVSQGVLPEHAALYIKQRTHYLNEFFLEDAGTPRFPLKRTSKGQTNSSTPNSVQKEFITHEESDPDAWTCICRNTPCGGGFYPCNSNGDEVEPVEGKWDDLYVCADCGRIIQQDTLEVVGQNPDWKPLG